ncbi:nucleotide exchange factor GrpE [Montanilutibacter psychrotolerans]|uniref:Protein GrpE n=1 Tax=Montanilutibacter psychrotolerans TaxID=1327343 RepID=A0A3M8SVW2_9GAMM|nr:nucleotide exchange factor GrpE [Lysobacter psychrotolerans]RNF85429.1 nucleotide exchange factor GrpE [Lysobacter psychrotolerans]
MTTEPIQDTADQAADTDDTNELAVALEAAQAELAKLREDSLRERADLENQRRRLERERDMARKFANERLLGELLPVIDSLEAGLAVASDGTGALRDGMELTLRQLLKVAGDNGLTAVNPTGQAFNPEQHQAMSMVHSDEHAPGHVVQVFQKGWLLNDRLLRPALVVVSSEG